MPTATHPSDSEIWSAVLGTRITAGRQDRDYLLRLQICLELIQYWK